MANPKRRHSKARTASRRAQFKIKTTPVVQECPDCGAPQQRHRACPSCGSYRGRTVTKATETA